MANQEIYILKNIKYEILENKAAFGMNKNLKKT